jgi:hypothetical protein
MLQQLYQHIQHLQQRVEQLQQQQPPPAPVSHPSIKPVKPERFSGTTSTDTLPFLQSLKRYFALSRLALTDAHILDYCANFLTGTATTWFEGVQVSGTPITTFEEFEEQLKKRFIPYGIELTARTEIRRIKQKNFKSLQEYTVKFQQLLNHIPDMPVDSRETFDNYVDGLKPFLQNEIIKSFPAITTFAQAASFAAMLEQRWVHQNMFRADAPLRTGVRPAAFSSFPAAHPTSQPMEISHVDGTTRFHEEEDHTVDAADHSPPGTCHEPDAPHSTHT